MRHRHASQHLELHASFFEPMEPRLALSVAMPLAPLADPAPAPGGLVTMGPSLAGSFNGTAGSLIGLEAFRADQRFAGIDGRGFSTVVIDTGIDPTHPFFGPDADANGVADRIVFQWDFADNDPDATDRHGHGSNVASIAAGLGDAYSGVATGAGIVALKVFSDSGAGDFRSVERALQWVVSNTKTFNISSVNLSLGDSRNYTKSQRLYGISDEIEKITRAGVKVIAAAGNDFYTFNSAMGVSYPAADPNVIGVGAGFAQAGGDFASASGAQAWGVEPDEIAPFSQRHATMTPIFAPGAPMLGAGAFGSTITMAGTSQASPVVAGAAVLADQLASTLLGRRLSAGEFKSIITSTGVAIRDGDNENDNVSNTQRTYRRLDVQAMAEKIVSMAPKKKAAAPAKPSAKAPASAKAAASKPAQPAKAPASAKAPAKSTPRAPAQAKAPSTPKAPAAAKAPASTAKAPAQAAKAPATSRATKAPASRVARKDSGGFSFTRFSSTSAQVQSALTSLRDLRVSLDAAGVEAQSTFTGPVAAPEVGWTMAI